MKRLKQCVMGITAAICMVTAAEAKPLKVVVCAGQSNMVGKFSKFSDLPADMQNPKNLVAFDGEKWVELIPKKYQKSGFGPELSCVHTLSKMLNEPIGIVKHAVGSTSLYKSWSKDNTRWSQYPKLRKKVQDAQKSRDIEIIGMIWMQGEADSSKKESADTYAANLVKLIERSRNDFQSPSMIFIAGRVNPPMPKFSFSETVRKAQEDCAVSRYSWIDCDSFSKSGDNLHYDLPGLVDMGIAFAKEMKKQLGK